MAGGLLGSAIPFLGPAVAAWIALVVGVMAFYLVSVFRQYRTKDVQAPVREPSTSTGPQPRNEPWGAPPRPLKARVDLSVYDMEDYPDEDWALPAGFSVP